MGPAPLGPILLLHPICQSDGAGLVDTGWSKGVESACLATGESFPSNVPVQVMSVGRDFGVLAEAGELTLF